MKSEDRSNWKWSVDIPLTSDPVEYWVSNGKYYVRWLFKIWPPDWEYLQAVTEHLIITLEDYRDEE